jgi:hypothetical protein
MSQEALRESIEKWDSIIAGDGEHDGECNEVEKKEIVSHEWVSIEV